MPISTAITATLALVLSLYAGVAAYSMPEPPDRTPNFKEAMQRG